MNWYAFFISWILAAIGDVASYSLVPYSERVRIMPNYYARVLIPFTGYYILARAIVSSARAR